MPRSSVEPSATRRRQKAKAPLASGASAFTEYCYLVHIAHAAAVSRSRRSFLLFRNLRDQGFGSEHQAGNRTSVLQRGAHDLRWIEYSGLNQVLVLVREGVVTVVRL